MDDRRDGLAGSGDPDRLSGAEVAIGSDVARRTSLFAEHGSGGKGEMVWSDGPHTGPGGPAPEHAYPLHCAGWAGATPPAGMVGGVTGVLILGINVVLPEVDNVFRALLPPPGWLLNILQDIFDRENQLLFRVFLLVIVAPLTEELLLRGVILRALLSRLRPAAAIVMTAFLFAADHLNPWQFFSALFLRCASGWFYLHTGSIALCVLAQAFTNALTIMFSALPWHVPGMNDDAFGHVEFQPWGLDLSGLAMVLAGIWVFRKASPGTHTDEMPAPPVITPSGGIVP